MTESPYEERQSHLMLTPTISSLNCSEPDGRPHWGSPTFGRATRSERFHLVLRLP